MLYASDSASIQALMTRFGVSSKSSIGKDMEALNKTRKQIVGNKSIVAEKEKKRILQLEKIDPLYQVNLNGFSFL